MKEKITNLIVKIVFIILFLNMITLLKTEVNAATYGIDYFGEEYSNGYIRNCNTSNFIGASSGVSVKTGKQIGGSSYFNNSSYNNSNNTSKSAYVDYSQAARYINSNGEPIWLDMRIYIWSNNAKYRWTLSRATLEVDNIYTSGTQHTTMEFHFYTVGHCGDSKYEQSFKGVTCITDLDPREGVLIYSGYNRFFKKSGIPPTYVAKGNKNSTSGNNPFSTSGTTAYPYFFGTRENNSTDNVWIEINSTPSSPFKITYGTRNSARGTCVYYTGSPIEYYVDGVLKDTYYCVPYGTYKLVNPEKLIGQKKWLYN